MSNKKHGDTNLASTNMVKVRRDEIERLEKKRIDLTREIESIMRKYSSVTGDKAVPKRKKTIGRAANDWNSKIDPNWKKKPMKLSTKLVLIASAVIAIFFGVSIYIYVNEIDLIALIKDLLSKMFTTPGV